MPGKLRGTLLAACAAASVLSSGPRGWAQDPPTDTAIDLQLFDEAIGPRTFMSVNDGTIQQPHRFNLDFMVTFLTDPYTVYNVTESDQIVNERTNVVTSLVAGQLSGAYGLHPRFHLGAMLPVIFSMSGNGLDPSTAMPTDGFTVAGLGDLRVELKTKVWENDRIKVSAAPVVTVPTSFGGNSGNYMGDDLPTFRGYGAASWTSQSGKLAAGANLGFIIRKPREIYAGKVSHQATFGAAFMFKPIQSVALIAETFGRTGFGNFLDTESSPWEAAGTARVKVSKTLYVSAGGGAGLVAAIGSPALRFFAAVGWNPDFGDEDGDGVTNLKDGCPLVAEDKDGYEDSDGCPDTDNDSDIIEDSEDKCPKEPEDKDGFEDEDGCPDLDNDGDKLLDIKDQCPKDAEDGAKPFPTDGCPAGKTDIDLDGVFDDKDQCSEDPEDMDGFNDWDGCPDADNDGDGVADENDQCPLCREDKDGFQDEDGCPEIDNDNDGVADSQDQCPAKAEVVNGIKDDDGCPDSGRAVVSLDGDRIDYKGAISFRGGNRLAPASQKVLAQVGALMRSQTSVTKWRIVVALASSGSAVDAKIKAQSRAEVIKKTLVDAGVPAERIDAIGVGAERELVAFSVLERGSNDVANGGVCPAGFEAQPKADPGAGSAGDAEAGSDASGGAIEPGSGAE